MVPPSDKAQTVTESSATAVRSDVAWKVVARLRVPLPFHSSEDPARHRALERWKLILAVNLNESLTGRQLLKAEDALDPGGRCAMILEDTLSSKATATLLKRGDSLLHYVRWHSAFFPKRACIPFDEESCYNYVCEQRAAKCSPSKLQAFLESLGFAAGVFGISGASEVRSSARMKGAAITNLKSLGFIVKCDEFTVEQLVAMENYVVHGPDGPNRGFLGYICLLTGLRSRYSDAMFLASEPSLEKGIRGDRHFVEISPVKTKTSNTKAKLRQNLPYVGFGTGVSGLNWAEAWLNYRLRVGLVAGPDRPTMPSISAAGNWTDSPLRCGEANVWLLEVLRSLSCSPAIDQRIRTHSCKVTLLAYSAKFGLKLSDRRILGYHVKPQDKSALEYSRDGQARPLRLLKEVLDAIQAGVFRPGMTRSGRFYDTSVFIPPVPADEVLLVEPAILSPASAIEQAHNLEESPVDCVTPLVDDADPDGQNDSMSLQFSPDQSQLLQCSACSSFAEFVGHCNYCLVNVCPNCCGGSDWYGNQCAACFKGSADDDPPQELSDSDSSEEESASDSEEEASRNSEVIAARSAVPRELGEISDRTFAQHRVSKVLHVLKLDERFECGRLLSDSYEALSSRPSFNHAECSQCFSIPGPKGA